MTDHTLHQPETSSPPGVQSPSPLSHFPPGVLRGGLVRPSGSDPDPLSDWPAVEGCWCLSEADNILFPSEVEQAGRNTWINVRDHYC